MGCGPSSFGHRRESPIQDLHDARSCGFRQETIRIVEGRPLNRPGATGSPREMASGRARRTFSWKYQTCPEKFQANPAKIQACPAGFQTSSSQEKACFRAGKMEFLADRSGICVANLGLAKN